MSPFAFIVGVRSSVAATSLRRLVGRAQSHIEITMLRSTPFGRGGATLGKAPSAIRSVQSAYILRCTPSALKLAALPGPEGPIVVWRSPFSRLDFYDPRFFLRSRGATSPPRWHE